MTDTREPTVAELEAQRAAEQEALRNVRRLTDRLEEEQRERQRARRWGLRIALAALVLLFAAVGAVYFKARQDAQPARIDVPAKVVVPQK